MPATWCLNDGSCSQHAVGVPGIVGDSWQGSASGNVGVSWDSNDSGMHSEDVSWVSILSSASKPVSILGKWPLSISNGENNASIAPGFISWLISVCSTCLGCIGAQPAKMHFILLCIMIHTTIHVHAPVFG
jgi:hypothetical protein